MIISIPSHGMGDVLYDTIAQVILQEDLKEESIIFCRPASSIILTTFGVRYSPYYSKVLYKSIRLDIANERAFWSELYKHRRNKMFSVLNDIIDEAIRKLFQFEYCNNRLGNYYYRHSFGVRSKINKAIIFNNYDINPKHLIERYKFAIPSLSKAQNSEVLQRFKLIFSRYLPNNNIKAGTYILVFPDSRELGRNITIHQLKSIISTYGEKYEVKICTTQKLEEDIIKCKNVEIFEYGSLVDSINECYGAALIICADSFSSHFSGLSGRPTIVLHNKPKDKKYCEYLGSPFENVYHVEEGKIYQLNSDFRAYEVSRSNRIISEFEFDRILCQ